MNTKQIDYCIELAHTLNFSRAAENLFVSQPYLQKIRGIWYPPTFNSMGTLYETGTDVITFFP